MTVVWVWLIGGFGADVVQVFFVVFAVLYSLVWARECHWPTVTALSASMLHLLSMLLCCRGYFRSAVWVCLLALNTLSTIGAVFSKDGTDTGLEDVRQIADTNQSHARRARLTQLAGHLLVCGICHRLRTQ